MLSRPSVHAYFAAMARLVASRGTCARRQVGCVLVNERRHVLATGYNGRPSGWQHCEGIFACKSANEPSGQGLDGCEAIHAEQNALLQCRDVREIHTCYTTVSPCLTCVKLLLNTSCKFLVFSELYPHNEALDLWCKSPHRGWMLVDEAIIIPHRGTASPRGLGQRRGGTLPHDA